MNLEKFARRLKELMELDGISIRALALKIGVDRRSIRLWLKAKFFPRYDALIKLSIYFAVKIDYLIGRGDAIDDGNRKNINIAEIEFGRIPAEFSKKFSGIMAQYGLTVYAVSKNLHVDAKAVKKWLSGGSMPETINLIGLAKLANISVDELLGMEQ